MENNNKQDFSNTMEINAILEEARRNRAQASGKAHAKVNSPQQSKVSTQPVRAEKTPKNDLSDDFVIIDDTMPKKTRKQKNGKKTAVVVSIVAGVLVLLLAVGFCVYSFLGEFEYANNVYVNDIALGGLSEKEAEKLLADEETKLAESIAITVNAGDNSIVLTKDDFTYTFNTDDVLKEAKEYSKDNLVHTGQQNYKIAIEISDADMKTVVEKVSTALCVEAEDAKVTAFDSSKSDKERFTVQDEKTGVAVDSQGFEHQLDTFLGSGNVSGAIDAQADITEPKITKEYLLNNIKKLSSFTTVSTNNANGNSNMKLSLSACNNSIINPGEVWSFNGCTGDSNKTSLGYKPAGVIVEGRSSTGVGGGICQSSTTIYNAAVMCGMEIVERECHYYKSSYVDAGRDATVDYGNIDLKVKNIFDYQLFMECYMKGTTLYCNMYGLENPEFDEIKISSSVTSYFSNGFRAETSRTYYLDGKKVKTEKLPNSTYYTSAPSSSSSTPKPTQKPTTSEPTQAPTTTPTPTPDPEPTPDPQPTPDPEPQPTPDPEPAPDPGTGGEVVQQTPAE